MKKLLALLAAGGLLALTTGCPPGTTSSFVPAAGTTPGGTTPGGTTPGGTTPGGTTPGGTVKPGPGGTTPGTGAGKEGTVTGKVTKAEGDKITVKPETGEAKDYTISDDKVVMIDGKAGKASEIKRGDTATVTWNKEGKVTAVEVKAPGGANPPPLPPPPADKSGKITGKVTKAEGDKITVKPETGEAKDYTISDDKVVTINDKPGKASEIKMGDTVTVTWDKEGKVTAVEDKQPK